MKRRPCFIIDRDNYLTCEAFLTPEGIQAQGDRVVFYPPPKVPPGKRAKWLVGLWRLEDIPGPPPKPVDQLRREAYPPITEQLDALWHAMDTGVLPKVPAFYEPIRAVKERFPK